MISGNVVYALGALVLLGAMVGVAMLLNAMQKQQDDARDGAYQAYCDQRGYEYAAARPGEEKQYLSMLSFFNEGDNRLWQCEVSGSLNGRPFTAFEFTFVLGGRYRKTFPHAFMRWERAGDELPSFLLRPIDELNRDTFGDTTRVEFPDDEIFTFAYALLAQDPDTLRTFFTAERRNAIRPLLQADPQQYVRASGPTLFWYHTEYLPPPEQLDAFIAAGDRIAATLLDY